MIEPTDAPLPEGNKNPNTGNTDVLQGSPLKQSVGYKFNSNDNAGGIRVFYSGGTYAVSLTHNTDFTPSPVSVLDSHRYALHQHAYWIFLRFLWN